MTEKNMSQQHRHTEKEQDRKRKLRKIMLFYVGNGEMNELMESKFSIDEVVEPRNSLKFCQFCSYLSVQP